MTADERALLLTVARILRAHLRDLGAVVKAFDDLEALDEALAPFDPSDAEPTNEGDSHPASPA